MATPTPDPSSATARRAGLGTRVGVVAAIAIGVAVALRLMGGATPTPDVSHPGVVNAPDPAPADPARWLAAFPLEPLDAPAIAGNTAADRALRAALEPYRKGDYAAAATALDGFLLDHPGDPVATLYLGISRLFMDEPQNALEILRGMPGSASERVMAESEWYAVVGAARLRDPSAAESDARILCERKGPASARACAALERLGNERQKAKD